MNPDTTYEQAHVEMFESSRVRTTIFLKNSVKGDSKKKASLLSELWKEGITSWRVFF